MVATVVRVTTPTASDAGEAHYVVLIQPGETIHAGDGRKLLVLEVTPTEDEASEYVGMLRVEVA